jgi:Protein of unknown function (DUF3562)
MNKAAYAVPAQAPLQSLRSYARAKGIPEDLVLNVYEEEVRRLDKAARVKRFVPLLAEKHAKAVLNAYR